MAFRACLFVHACSCMFVRVRRCRNYLRDVATRHGVTFSSSVRKAVQTVVDSHKMNAGLKVKVEPDIDVALAIQ